MTRWFSGALRYGLLILLLIVMVFPMAWMFRVSVMPAGAGLDFKSLGDARATLGNYMDLFLMHQMGRYLFNSVIVGLLVTVGNILFCFMVAYSLARHRTVGNKVLFATIILVLMIPAHILIVPFYVLMVKSRLYDSYWALILPWLVNPIGIFLVKQYIESVPPAMEEAARLDGAGEPRILLTIVMPLCKPALAVLAIQVFFTNWNSFLFPYILTSSDKLRTLPVGLALYQGHQAIDWQHLMAGSAVAVLPVLLLFLLLQRHIVSGITAGAMKQ
ncbi:MAG TPA: carbohydrate ABC transporter permease [Candidatus Deferrimicrobium sp.]|nr:carbohydrate ABC transporter permease [Candidatus Deferrimicrobium sp.]